MRLSLAVKMLVTNAQRPGNEAKHSPREDGGQSCVAECCLIKFMRGLVIFIFIFIFLPAYQVMFLT